MSNSHSAGYLKGEFCTIRTSGSACGCGNSHITNSDIDKKKTGDKVFKRTQKVKGGGDRQAPKFFEAHHLVCIACATKWIGKDPKIEKVVSKTKWCINAKKNMLGMPLWGHTIKWYCTIGSTVTIVGQPLPPPFALIPMHNEGHNGKGSYITEVDGKMDVLSKQIKRLAAQQHKEPEKELADELDKNSDHFRTELARRGGTRHGGTHLAWIDGMSSPKGDWYKPFSMADDGNEKKRTFPAAGERSKIANKLAKMAKAFKRWGSI